MEVTKNDLGNLVSEITIQLETEDYKPEFEQELKKYKNKAHIKGFRKGKVPVSALKKMYGKSLLAEIVNRKVSDSFDKYLKEQKLDILGQPIPMDKESDVELDVYTFGMLKYSFKVGCSPEFELEGVEEQDVYDHFEVRIADELVEEEFFNIRKRFGSEEDIEKIIEDGDRISLKVNELDDENSILEDGIEAEFTILVDRMPDNYKENLVGKSIGEEMVINILEIEKDVDRAFVCKYLLNVEENVDFNEHFKAQVASIKNLVPAEVNQEFFDQGFGEGQVNSEEAAKEIIRKELLVYYDTQGKALSECYILEELLEKNEMDLPHEFLKEWLLFSNKELKEEDIAKEYSGFEKNLRWSLIKGKVGDKFQVNVDEKDLVASMVEKVKAQMQAYNYPGLDFEAMARNVLQDPERARKEFEDVYARKVFEEIMDTVALKKTKLDMEEYKNRVEELREKTI